MADKRRFRLFVYGTFLPDEPDAELLEGATPLGPARTEAKYQLVELGANAALLDGGNVAVVGEVYELSAQILARCDVKREHPVLYVRRKITLEDGSEAYTYFLRPEQTRARRRVRGGDWKKRFSAERPDPGPFVKWARRRHRY